MAEHYFIVPYRILADFYEADLESAKDLYIDPVWYKEKLQEKWHSLKFFAPDEPALLSWKRAFSEKFFGYDMILWDDYQTVTVRGPDYAFILWHRIVIPTRFRLFVYNDSEMDNNILELTADTTFEDMENAFGKLLTPEEFEAWAKSAIKNKKKDDTSQI